MEVNTVSVIYNGKSSDLFQFKRGNSYHQVLISQELGIY